MPSLLEYTSITSFSEQICPYQCKGSVKQVRFVHLQNLSRIRCEGLCSRSRPDTKVAEAVVWPKKETGCDVNSNYYALPPPSAHPPSSPSPSSLPPYVSHLTVKELPSWTNPRHQRSSSVSSSSTGSLGSSAFPPHQTTTPKTSIGFASDRVSTPHNNSYRMQQDTHRSDDLLL